MKKLFSPDIAGGESYADFCRRYDANKIAVRRVAIFFAVAVWSLVIVQACQMQFVDDQAFNQLAQEQNEKLQAERIAAEIIQDTLSMTNVEAEKAIQKEALQLASKLLAAQEQELGTISVSADSTQVFEYNQ